MKNKNLGLRVASVVFLIAGLVHVVRFVKGWAVMIGDYPIRLRMSLVAAAVAIALGVWLWMLACDKADSTPPKA